MKVTLNLAVILAASLLLGCGEQQWQASVDEYRERITRVLDIESEPLSWQVEPINFPSRRELLLPEPELYINMLDFLRISQCDLQRLVGERNSALAKVQSGSQRLFYHLSFIELAQKCLDSGHVEGELKGALEEAVAAKRDAIPTYIANAFFRSQELQALFQPFGELNPIELGQMPAKLEQALEVIARVHRDAFGGSLDETHSKSYEQALQVIGSSQYVGVLIHQHRQLASAMRQMRGLLQGNGFCVVSSSGAVLLTPSKRDALLFILRKHYIASVQQAATYLVRQRKQFLELWSMAESGVSKPQALELYWQAMHDQFAEFDELLAWHTKYWQVHLQRCQMSLQK